jgi:hypothetical protein
VLWVFLLAEVGFGVVQLVPWWRGRRSDLVDDIAAPAEGHPSIAGGR